MAWAELPEGDITAARLGPCPKGRSRTGYGPKQPTPLEIRVKGSHRWHRVWCAIWSNIGTAYVQHRGQKCIVPGYMFFYESKGLLQND